MPQYQVYIAGAMGGRRVSEVLAERRWARAWLNVKGLSFYDPAQDEGLDKLHPNCIISLKYSKAKMKRFVNKDLAAVAESKYVLNLTGDRISDGTAWEMAYATFYRLLPVYCVAPKRANGELMGFTNILSTHLFDTIKAAVCAIAKEEFNGL